MCRIALFNKVHDQELNLCNGRIERETDKREIKGESTDIVLKNTTRFSSFSLQEMILFAIERDKSSIISENK